jgi:Protein of unknown function (DUF2637)
MSVHPAASGPRSDGPVDTRDTEAAWPSATDRQTAARRAYLASVADKAPLSGVALGAMFNRSARWGSRRIVEARLDHDGAGGTRGSAVTGRRTPARPRVGRDGSHRHADEGPPEFPLSDRHADSRPREVPSGATAAGGTPRTTVLAVTVVALVAAVASYDHQRSLAEIAGEDWRAWLLPISVDGLVLVASCTMLVRRRVGHSGGVLAWAALLLGLTASLSANVAAAGPTLIGRLVAAWPPVALLFSYELLMQQVRVNLQRDPGRIT